uniref:CO dehydrogenase nickel-insertion accessory protein CooC n=1 Tax=Thermofilum pendens TaxID=2269 RepID=A0A7C4D3W5_THEPE
MKVVVTGKGGTGKTSTAAALSLQLAEMGYKVLAIDADSFPNLARSLGLSDENVTPLTHNLELVRERTGAAPGDGWGLFFSLTPKVDDLAERYGVKVSDNLSLVVLGGIEQPGEGCMCPAVALAKAFLRHVLANRGEFVVVDSEAGLEAFGRGLVEYFDLNICVAEPTVKALEACAKIFEMSEKLGVRESILVVNKVRDLAGLGRLLERFPAQQSFFSIRFDSLLEKVEREGLGIREASGGFFWSDVKVLARHVVSQARWEKCAKAR